MTKSSIIRAHLGADGLLKSPLKLIGGKTGIKKDSARSRVYGMIPADTQAYIEPFCGSGGVLIGKEPHTIEMLGDLDPWPIRFMQAMQERPYEQFEVIQLMWQDMTEAKYNLMRFNEPNYDTHPLTAVAWYYVINKWARNGIVRWRKSDGKCNSTWCKEERARGLLTPDWLWRVHRRLQGVALFNQSYDELLAKATSVSRRLNTFVFLDPPYNRVFTKYGGGIEFKDEQHQDLAALLQMAPYRWLLTINDNPFIRSLYEPWAETVIINPSLWQCSNTNKGRRIENELIIANFGVV